MSFFKIFKDWAFPQKQDRMTADRFKFLQQHNYKRYQHQRKSHKKTSAVAINKELTTKAIRGEL